MALEAEVIKKDMIGSRIAHINFSCLVESNIGSAGEFIQREDFLPLYREVEKSISV